MTLNGLLEQRRQRDEAMQKLNAKRNMIAAQNEVMRGKIASYNKHIELNEQALQNTAEKLVKLQAERDELSKQIETWTE